jgi:hypothetical protein
MTQGLPSDLQRTSLVNTLAFCNAFPETLREQLLVPWSEETSMPDRTPRSPTITDADLSYTPKSESTSRHHHHSASHSKSTSMQSRSVEESHLHVKKISRHRAPSPATHIDQLRRVLAGASISRSHRDSVPKIEINGEKVITPAESSHLTPDVEKEDVTMILQSLNLNAQWSEKNDVPVNEKLDGGIKPPYGI